MKITNPIITDAPETQILSANKLPTDSDTSAYPDNSQKLIKYSPLIISGSNTGKIKIYNMKTGNIMANIKCDDEIYDLVITPDNKYVVFIPPSKNNIGICEFKTTDMIYNIDCSESVSEVCISMDNKYIITASNAYTINIFDFTGGKIRTITSPLVLNIDENNISYDDDDDDENNDFVGVENNFMIDNISALVITADNKYIVAGSECGRIKIWDFGTAILVNTLKTYSNIINTIAITTDNKYIVSGSYDSTIKILEFETGKIIHTLTDHSGSIFRVKITSNNKYIVSVSNDTTIKIWRLKTGKLINTLTKHKGCVTSLTITQDNKYIITGSDDKTIKTWHLKTGKLIRSIKLNTKINSIAITHPIPYSE